MKEQCDKEQQENSEPFGPPKWHPTHKYRGEKKPPGLIREKRQSHQQGEGQFLHFRKRVQKEQRLAQRENQRQHGPFRPLPGGDAITDSRASDRHQQADDMNRDAPLLPIAQARRRCIEGDRQRPVPDVDEVLRAGESVTRGKIVGAGVVLDEAFGTDGAIG